MDLLPLEMVEKVTEYVGAQELATCCAVSKRWREALNQDSLWKRHCNPVLEKYLHSTPSVVYPSFVRPDTDSITLAPICHWRLAFMREKHLYNNWRLGNYKKEVLAIPNGCYLFISDYLVVLSGHVLELWDLKENCRLHEYCWIFVPDIFCNVKSVKNNIFIISSFNHLAVFEIDFTKKRIFLKHVFLFDHLEKLCNFEFLVIEKRLFIENSTRNLGHAIVGTTFLAVSRSEQTMLHVWNLDEGKKLKVEPCPQNESNLFYGFVYSDTSEDIVVIMTDQFITSFYYYVYSPKLLAFLPFTHVITKNPEEKICLIHKQYFAIYDEVWLHIFNYHTNNLILKVHDTWHVNVIANNIVFFTDEGFNMFKTLSETIVLLNDRSFSTTVLNSNSIFFKVLSIDNCLDGIWEMKKSGWMKKTNNSELSKFLTFFTNQECTKVLGEGWDYQNNCMIKYLFHFW